MKRLVLVVLFVACSALGFSEGAGSNIWLWPVISEWQSYEVGQQTPMEGSFGNAQWPTTKTMEDPFRSAREGTLDPTVTTASSGDQSGSAAKK